MAVNPVPSGYPQVTPYLSVNGAAAAIEFYTQVFGATERMRMPGPGDTVGHAELELGDSVIMLADEAPDIGFRSPKTLGGTPVIVSVYVEDVDAVVERAVAAGATVTMPVDDMFWGDRYGKVTDPFGHEWEIATHTEDLTPEEMQRRGEEFMASMG